MTRIDWDNTCAAIWRARQGNLRPVTHLDPVRLEDLVGIDEQKRQLGRNTARFIQGLPANHVLLWGSRGTGKSSLVKAIFNASIADGLRVIQVDRDDLYSLPDIVDDIRDLRYRFILFCDDLSFGEEEHGYRSLKSVLEGSVELPPDNVLIYATSNRRHLLPESMQDNRDSRVVDHELHLADAIEEKISLSDRFGLWLSFHPISQEEYLRIVDHYFPGYAGDREQLHVEARRFAQRKGVRSGRTAQQFYRSYADEDKPDGAADRYVHE